MAQDHTAQQLGRADAVRSQIEYEDNLVANRLSWLIASQSFLFTGYAIVLNRSRVKIVPDLVASPKLGVGPNLIGKLRPCHWGEQKPVGHQQRLFARIEGLHKMHMRLPRRMAHEVTDDSKGV